MLGIHFIRHENVTVSFLVNFSESSSLVANEHIRGKVWHEVGGVWAWKGVDLTLSLKVGLDLLVVFNNVLY